MMQLTSLSQKEAESMKRMVENAEIMKIEMEKRTKELLEKEKANIKKSILKEQSIELSKVNVQYEIKLLFNYNLFLFFNFI